LHRFWNKDVQYLSGKCEKPTEKDGRGTQSQVIGMHIMAARVDGCEQVRVDGVMYGPTTFE